MKGEKLKLKLRIQIGNVIKYWYRALSVSKSYHQWRQNCSCQTASQKQEVSSVPLYHEQNPQGIP